FLLGKHFHLITDQEALSFIFNKKQASKIKNEKITRWRLELAPFSYDITYRPGAENVKADALSRICNAVSVTELYELHKSLCHPGITRMYHWLRSKNLPYSLEDVRRLNCSICAEVKPRFMRTKGTLIKATSPFERLNMDFKGPLPSKSKNRYLLTIIDEYSRFPFAYPCRDISSDTVVECLKNLFCTFGVPAYIHTDRGTSFMSQEVKAFLCSNGVATSRTTPYNPQGNGQVERLNGTLWRTITLALKTRGLPVQDWEEVLQESLHAIRSLLCTAINTTPHERLFSHPRRTANGEALPSWLAPGPVLAKCNRKGKYDKEVEEVELIEANPQYALIRWPNGVESTVSLRQLAPAGNTSHVESPEVVTPVVADGRDTSHLAVESQGLVDGSGSDGALLEFAPPVGVEEGSPSVKEPRQSQRIRNRPAYLKDYVN
ncbi:uncharacterized protein LOC112126213, partial [Cimex lectularius]